ncbi:MAG: hypothetical protein ACRAVC_05175, partial [Trichormus sp.]
MVAKHKQKHRIISNLAIFQVKYIKYIYLKFGTTLVTLIGLTFVSLPLAQASDPVFGDSHLNLSATNSYDTSTEIDSASDASIEALEIPSSLPEMTFANKLESQNMQTPEFIDVDTAQIFSTDSTTGIRENLEPNLLTSDAELQPQHQTQIIAQTDSSEVVGDTLGDTNKLRQELLIEPIVTVGKRFRSAPGSSAGTPSAYGASFRQAYIGGSLSFP